MTTQILSKTGQDRPRTFENALERFLQTLRAPVATPKVTANRQARELLSRLHC